MRFWILILFFVSPFARANQNSHEFVMSCSYGVMAGALVGAGALAFTKHPSQNLNYIARGASYGLYSGIILGLYVIYGLPLEDEPRVSITPIYNLQAQLDGAKGQIRIFDF